MAFLTDITSPSPDALQRSATIANQPLKPDQAAEAAAIARKVGTTPAQVAQDIDGHRTRAQQMDAAQALTGSGMLSDWLGNEQNAALASDDLKPLSLIERLGRGDYWKDRGQRLAKGATQQISSLSKGAALFQQGTSELATEGVKGRIGDLQTERQALVAARADESAMGRDTSGYDQNIARIDKELETAIMQAGAFEGVANTPIAQMRDFVHGERLDAEVEEAFGAPDERLDEEFTAQLATGFGQVFGMIATALVPGVGTGVAATSGVTMGMVDLYEDAVANGADEETALKAAGYGGLIGTTEILPFMRALSPFEKYIPDIKKRGLAVLDRVARSMGEEAVQEGIQTTLENLTAAGLYDPDRGTFEGVGEAMAVGGIIGGSTGVIGSNRRPRQLIRDVAQAETAPRTGEKLAEVDAAIAQSKLRERDPAAFRDYVEKTGLADVSLSVPADALNEFFQGEVPADALMIGQEVFEEALSSGRDVHIPMSVYADKISGTDSAKFFHENARLPDETMSLTDAQKFNDGWQEEAMRVWEEVEALEVEELNARAGDVQVQDAVFSQLRAAGRSPDVAQRESQLWGAFFRSMGERYGEDSLDLARQFGLQIKGVEDDVKRLRGNLDIALNTLRSGKGKQAKPESLLEFVINNGGLQDTGGDLADLELTGKRAAAIAETRESMGQTDMLGRELKGMGIDQMGRRAMEEGFISPGDADSVEPDYGRILIEALRGEANNETPVYRAGEIPDSRMDELQGELDRLGIDLSTMTNDEVFALMQEGPQDGALNQAPVQTAEEFLATEGEWRDQDVKVQDENGAEVEVPAGLAADILQQRLEQARAVLECLNAG